MRIEIDRRDIRKPRDLNMVALVARGGKGRHKETSASEERRDREKLDTADDYAHEVRGILAEAQEYMRGEKKEVLDELARIAKEPHWKSQCHELLVWLETIESDAIIDAWKKKLQSILI